MLDGYKYGTSRLDSARLKTKTQVKLNYIPLPSNIFNRRIILKTLIFTYVKQPNTDQEKCFQVIILPNSNPEQNGTEHNEGGEKIYITITKMKRVNWLFNRLRKWEKSEKIHQWTRECNKLSKMHNIKSMEINTSLNLFVSLKSNHLITSIYRTM